MSGEVQYGRRTLLVLFLLGLIFYSQSAALVAARAPHHAAGHCCLLCHAGPVPFLQTTSTASAAPNLLVEHLAPNQDVQASRDVLLHANSSRAPPA